MSASGRVAAVVLAGGSGTRFGADGNKAYVSLAGRPLLSWSLDTLGRLPEVGRLVLVVRAEDRAAAADVLDRAVSRRPVDVIVGGRSRHGSEQAALAHLQPSIEAGATDLVLIHDGARPLVTPTLARAVISTAREVGGAVAGLRDESLAPLGTDGSIDLGARPDGLFRSQTPQAFHAPTLLEVYARAAADGFEGTDTSESVERYSDLPIRMVDGDPRNLKVTHPQDLLRADRLLAAADGEIT